ncbi:MAG: glycosyltransferase family 4 protein, partial [Candidatus Margulisbacteria bacterium]|nr:glycosyltransferase family 4 protein [Candidatus Margulisiibacteriota bacterium]
MHILFISNYFYPEQLPPTFRIISLARYWQREGCLITVLTGFPNYPSGKIPPFYKGKLFMKENIDGINVIRVPIFPSSNAGFLKRSISFFSFFASASCVGLFLKKRYSVVIATIPPPLVGLSGYLISKIMKIPFLLEVRDLWPENVKDIGISRNKILYMVLEEISAFLYRESNLIVTVTNSFKSWLKEKYRIREGKVATIFPISDSVELDLGIKVNGDKFVVSYFGNFGLCQNMSTVIEAAKILKEYSDIKFILVGDGPEREKIIKLKEKNMLKNIEIFPTRPRVEMIKLYNESDACIVILRNAAAMSLTLPSKLFEILNYGKPIILSIPEGEAKSIVENANAGIWVKPDSPQDLSLAILFLKENRDKKINFGSSGKTYFENNYS